MTEIEKKVELILNNIDKKGYLKKREGNEIEYKKSFGEDSLPKYAKTFAAFANKNGGFLIFGIEDSPHIKIGLQNNKFDKYDNAEFSKYLNDIFEPEILFEKGIIENNNLRFGYYYVKESNNKPIIAKKGAGNKQEIKEGEIYFRYNARNDKIKYPELKNIFDKNKQQFEKDWLNIITNISNIGINNINLINSKNGDTFDKNNKYLILDSKILNKMNYIKEGEFIEKNGAPTLTLKGELEINKAKILEIDKKSKFPYSVSQIHDKLKIESKLYCEITKQSQYYLKNFIFIYLNITNNNKYCYKDISGKRETTLYSNEALDLCVKLLLKYEEELKTFPNNEKKEKFREKIRNLKKS